MAAGDATSADVPGKYDVVINGKGYCLLDSLEESIPFRTHRAVYGQTQPFVERQNMSNSYGDNAQDFFLTVRQRDWSLGEQQQFFRTGIDGRYWMGQNVDVRVPGQVTLAGNVTTLTFSEAVTAGCREQGSFGNVVVAGATTLFEVSPVGNITSLGAHGLGAIPGRMGVVTDGVFTYLSTTAAGTVGVRKWNGAAYSTFSATGADALAYLNNTLYGLTGVNAGSPALIQYDTAGTATTLFTWKEADGTTSTGTPQLAKIEPFGGQLLILLGYGQEAGGELWLYDGVGVKRLEVLPANFVAYDVEVLYGVVYISGSYVKVATGTTSFLKPSVLFYTGNLGKLWEANNYGVSATGTLVTGPHPALAVSDGRLVFTDDTTGNIMAYNPTLGGVSSIGTYTTGGLSVRLIDSAVVVIHTRTLVGGQLLPGTSYPTSGYVISSLIDFESSLAKSFRGIKVEFNPASDGNGGTVDIAYQLDSLTGSWTTLQSGATSGTEYPLTGVSGHSLAIRVTLNKGTSTAGPTLKTMSLRGAPQMPVYPRGEYILDCTNTEEAPRELRDGSYHPLTGYDQVLNLVTARNSTSPISISDKVNGTYTGFVDVNDPQGFDVYEIHPAIDNPKKPGSYVVRLTVRGV